MAGERDHFALTGAPFSYSIPTLPSTAIRSPLLFTMRTSRLAQYAVNVCLPCSRHASTVPLLATRRIPLFTNLRISRRSITWASTPRQFPTSGVHSINPSEDIEEETLPTYEAEKYYPVQQGEVLGDRYQTLAKLGYGVTSTVWFARYLV